MAAKSATDGSGDIITVVPIKMTEMYFNLVGISPLVPHAVSAKAKGSLLFPAPKKNAAEKASSMKHEPYEEYRDAAYKFTDDDNQPVRFYMPADCVHAAMSSVAIDMVGARKAQIGRLTSVPGIKLPLYGIPKIYTTMVRSSDPQRTPDVRTLPILEKWALPRVNVHFVGSLIKEASIANLLANAGVIIGIGDGRPEKGKKTFGKFRLASDDDPELLTIMKSGTRKTQDAALAHPEYYDIETRQLLEWFGIELNRRAAAPAQTPRKRTKEGPASELVIPPVPPVAKVKNGRNIAK